MIDFDKLETQGEYIKGLWAYLMNDDKYPNRGYTPADLKERIDDLLYKEKQLKELYNKNHTFINIINLLNRNLRMMMDMSRVFDVAQNDIQRSKHAGYKQAIIDICEFLDDNKKDD